MRSLLKVLKQNSVSDSEEVVEIPDIRKHTVSLGLSSGQGMEEDVPAVDPQVVYETMVGEAREEGERVAHGLLEAARGEREELLAAARAEAVDIRETARREGLAAGIKEKADQLTETMAALKKSLEQLKAQHQVFMRDFAGEGAGLAVNIAEKLLQKRLTLQEEDMAQLVRSAVSAVKEADWITVELSNNMPRLIEKLRGQLHGPEGKPVDIVGKDVPPGTCVLKTSEGLIDASVETQLNNLRAYFNEE